MAVKILHGHDKLNPKLLIGFQFNEGRQHKKLTGSELDDFAWLVWQSRGKVHLIVRFKLLDMFICFSTRDCYFILFTRLWHCVMLWHIQVSGSIFNQVSQSPCALASCCSVLVFYYFIQVSSCISSLLWIRGIFVSLLYDVFFYWCIGLLEILQFISFQSNHCFSIVTVIADLQIWTSKCVRFTSVITSIVVSIKWNLFL